MQQTPTRQAGLFIGQRAQLPVAEVVVGYAGQTSPPKNTLQSLSAHFGVSAQPQMKATCVDPKLQWSQAKNIWYNAALRSAIYAATAPLRWVQKPFIRH